MPSFAFWKSSKPDESKSPLLNDAAVAGKLSTILPGASKAVNLDPGNQDSGVFLFNEDAQEIPVDRPPVIEETPSLPSKFISKKRSSLTTSTTIANVSLLDIDEPTSNPWTLSDSDVVSEKALVDCKTEQQPEHDVASSSQSDSASVEAISTPQPSTASEASQEEEECSSTPSQPVSRIPRETGPTLSMEKRSASAAFEGIETNLHDRDSGVYMSDNEGSSAQSQPSSIASKENTLSRSRVASLSSKTLTASPQQTKTITRLRRPAELNLGFSSAPDPAKPRSELDLRYDLIRNSTTQSKAALRSPTQLLQDRLNMSPKNRNAEEKARVFTPPRAMVNGCMLPGPAAQTEAFASTSVRARTEAGGRPAWWCKFDKLVVFDGMEHQGNGNSRLRTRTSKGLNIARRLGDLETVVIPLDCAHCHEMLNRHEWKYDIRVCKRSVCWDCKERCKWEVEQEKMASASTPRTDANRERADSMLQDEQRRTGIFV